MTSRRGPADTPEQRSLRARVAVHASWANTADRPARTAAGTDNSPARVDYWIRRLRRDDPAKWQTAGEKALRVAAESARRAHFLRLARASAASRRRAS